MVRTGCGGHAGNVGCYYIIRKLRPRESDGSPEVTQPDPEQKW